MKVAAAFAVLLATSAVAVPAPVASPADASAPSSPLPSSSGHSSTIETAPTNGSLPAGTPECFVECSGEGNAASGCVGTDWDCICSSQDWSVIALLCLVRRCPQDVGAGFAWHAAFCYRNSPPPGQDASPNATLSMSNPLASALASFASAAAAGNISAGGEKPAACAASAAAPALASLHAATAAAGLAAAAAAAALVLL